MPSGISGYTHVQNARGPVSRLSRQTSEQNQSFRLYFYFTVFCLQRLYLLARLAFSLSGVRFPVNTLSIGLSVVFRGSRWTPCSRTECYHDPQFVFTTDARRCSMLLTLNFTLNRQSVWGVFERRRIGEFTPRGTWRFLAAAAAAAFAAAIRFHCG